MKKICFSFVALLSCATMFTSCNEDTDAEDLRVLDFEGDKWTALIDAPQYGGDLLSKVDPTTGVVPYAWADEHTGLRSELTNAWGGTYGYAEGGVAISNYVDADLDGHAVLDYQLAVPVSNGSDNFAVVYCEAIIKFADGVAREMLSVDVSPTTYQLGVTLCGNAFAASLAHEGELTLVLTGLDADGTDTGAVVEIPMAKDGVLLENWKRFSTLALGKVSGVKFTMKGSDMSYGAVNQPAYCAIDNIIVRY